MHRHKALTPDKAPIMIPTTNDADASFGLIHRCIAADNHEANHIKIDGHCHCGEISFEAEVDPNALNICHCTDCQTLSGTAFRVNIPAPAEHFVLPGGTPKTSRSPKAATNAFTPSGQSAELRLAHRDNHAARGLLTEATRLATVCTALGMRSLPCQRPKEGDALRASTPSPCLTVSFLHLLMV
jgi:Glutathione-dependent formaldehyde-activating enzyme